MQTATQDLASTVTHFSDAAEWTGVTDEDRPAWLEMRRTMLTASDVAAVLGHGRNKKHTALSVYVEKITAPKPETIGLEDPRFWGRVLEQPILTSVANHNGWGYRRGGALLRSRRHPQLGATLDAEIDRHDGLGWIVNEGKTSQLPMGWDVETQDLPTHILLQAQAQLLVSGAPANLVFALLMGARPCPIDIEPNEELHRLIVEESEDFMVRLKRLDPPPPSEEGDCSKALEVLHGPGDGKLVELPAQAVEWSRELIEVATARKDLEAREGHLKDLLRAGIGTATYGVLPEAVGGKRYWRWQTQERKEHVVKASSSRVLLAMKNGPAVAAATAPEQTTPAEPIREAAETTASVTPITRKRRRSRR